VLQQQPRDFMARRALQPRVRQEYIKIGGEREVDGLLGRLGIAAEFHAERLPVDKVGQRLAFDFVLRD
jgi:hypothetical protein